MKPFRFRRWKWWRLSPGNSNSDPGHALLALASPHLTGPHQTLTIVRLRQGDSCQVWVSFVGCRDDSVLIQALAKATGCIAIQDEHVPLLIRGTRGTGWRVSHTTTKKTTQRFQWKDAHRLASVADDFLGDGEMVLTTILWEASGQLKARIATTSKQLPTAWVHDSKTKSLIPWPSPWIAGPLVVIVACSLIFLNHFFILLPFFEGMVLFYSPSTPTCILILSGFAILHSLWRLIREVWYPRMIQRVVRFWYLPLGWWVRKFGGTVSVARLAGWARAQ